MPEAAPTTVRPEFVMSLVAKCRPFWMVMFSRGRAYENADEAANDPGVRAGKFTWVVKQWFTLPGESLSS